MGAGAGCDAQYLFANDILGYTEGHVPRHARTYRDFGSEYARLQCERIAAFTEYAADVASGAFPEDRHLLRMDPRELEKFIDGVDRQRGGRPAQDIVRHTTDFTGREEH
jgi:3-methyl-2-oxobutanoate hydroxymethyltransferase